MNSTIRLESTPRRIVSLVPSQTELLHDLGLEDEVVGLTKFCIYPNHWFCGKHRVGGTKNVNLEKVQKLNPDLIIGNKEENSSEDIEALKKIAPVWMSDIYNLDDAKEMIAQVSEITDRVEEGKKIVEAVESKFKDLEKAASKLEGKKVLYYIWKDPNMVSGKLTFVDNMLEHCGLTNATSTDRYPEIDKVESQPDYIFLSSEPFPFKEGHRVEFQKLFPNSEIVLVDGEMFSWYGSRLQLAPKYFEELINHLA